jgi:hypothetical protein
MRGVGRVIAILGYLFALAAWRMTGMGSRRNRPFYWRGVVAGIAIGSIGASVWLIASLT